MTTLSLCMIVKNEEKVLARCLESVKDAVDEIIIVDTGSTDRTKEIAKQYGAQIFDFTWIDDFAAARQFAKEKATKDWILQLDADEYFMNDEAGKIKSLIQRVEDQDALLIEILNLAHEYVASHWLPRIFKNKDEIRYINPIHEEIFIDGRVIHAARSGIQLLHTGYQKEVIADKKKHQRNLKILKKQWAERQQDPFVCLNLSNEYFALKEYEKSLFYSKLSFEFGQEKTFVSRAALNVIQSYFYLGQFQEALVFIQKIKKQFEHYTEILFFEGRIYEETGDDEKAETIYMNCLAKGESEQQYTTVKGIGSVFPLERIAKIKLKQKKDKEALDILKLIQPILRYSEECLLGIAEVMFRHHKEEEWWEFFHRTYVDNGEDRAFKNRIQMQIEGMLQQKRSTQNRGG